MKRVLSLVLTLAMVLSLMAGICISVGAEGEEYIYIEGAEISGTPIPELAVGDTLPTLSYSVPAGANYTVSTYWWKDSMDADAGTAVENGYVYTLGIIVVANDGYAFGYGYSLLINGEEYSFQPTNGQGEGFETHLFEKHYSFLTPIDKVEVSYEEPEVGKALSVATAPADAKYRVTNSWYDYTAEEYPDDGAIAYKGGDYAIVMDIFPDAGYGFTDATEVWINGEKVDDANIEYDYIRYWSDSYNLSEPISSVSITYAEPQLGKAFPQAEVATDASYTVETCWYDVYTGEAVAYDTVKDGGAYQLVIRVYPKVGYKFAEEVTLTVNGSAVDDYDYDWGSDWLDYYASYSFAKPADKFEVSYDLPQIGKAPSAITIPEDANYTLGEYTGWYDYFTGEKVTGNFEDGKRYEMRAELRLNFGYEVSEDVVVYVNGEKTDDFGSRDTTVYVYKSYSFAEAVDKVELPAWPELNVGDKLPEISGEGERYSYHVEWRGEDAEGNYLEGDTVVDGAAYYATIYAYPAEGYEFTDDTKVTQNGKAPSGWLYTDYGYIELGTVYNFGAFKMIEKVELTTDIPGYGEKGGEVKIPENAGYELMRAGWGVSTKDDYSDAKPATKVYTYGDHVLLEVELDAKDGYMFSPDVVITLNGKEYEPVEFDCYQDFIYAFYDLGEITKPAATPETGDTTPVMLLSFLCLSALAGVSVLLSKKRIAR